MHYVKAKGIFTSDYGINIYRGCTHGCIYCDSRSEVYRFSHKFEDIEVKENAVELLKRELIRRKPFMVVTGAMTDPYVPIEKRLQHVRKCLEVIYRYGLKRLDENGIPSVVWLSPIMPYINDNEDNVNSILDFCIDANVKGVLNLDMGFSLRKGNREYFYGKLDEHFPGLRQRYVEEFGERNFIYSANNRKLKKIIENRCRKHGMLYRQEDIIEYMHEFPCASVQSKLM